MNNKINDLVTQLGKAMQQRKLTLVTAESCTAGGLAYYIATNSKASSILERGYIVYSNKAKEDLLNVQPYTLQTEGAVSKAVAIEMAIGGLKNSLAQVCVAMTGIAGPDLSTNEKKAKTSSGIVWISCVSNLLKTKTCKKIISGPRSQFVEQVILESLKQLLNYLKI